MLLAILLVLSLLAALFLLVPLFSRQAGVDVSLPREGINTLLFKDRLNELEFERVSGKIDQQQFEQLKLELERSLLADVQGEDSAAIVKSKPAPWAAIIVAVAVPLLSVVIYQWEGQMQAVNEWLALKKRWQPLIEGSLQGKTVTPEEAKDLTAGDYIRVLQFILQRTPEHVDGWQDLGTAYMQVGLHQFAEIAFRRAAALAPDNLDLALLVVESKLGQGKGALDADGITILHKILREDPSNPKARMMMGMVSYNQGNFENAIGMWKSLLNDTPEGSEGAQILQSSIARAEQKLNGRDKHATEPASVAQADSSANAPSIKVDVSVAQDVLPKIDGPYWLMVYAKAVGGMPMPVAIEKSAFQNPVVSITLDDKDAMAPMAKLSTSKSVKVFARLSKTGSAMPQPGDFFVESAPLEITPGQMSVALEISQIVK